MNRKDAVIPYYVQVAETLRRRITTGEYEEGSLLANTEEFEREFGVSKITIEKALGMLTEEGLLTRRRGLGTFVAVVPRDLVTIELSGSSESFIQLVQQLPNNYDVLDITSIPCPGHVASALGLESGSLIWRMEKIRKHEGVPLSHYFHYASPEACKGITKEEGGKERFLTLFSKYSHITLTRLEQTLEAVTADGYLSKVLNIRFGAPLLFVENRYFSTGDTPNVLTQIHFRGDRCLIKARTSL